MDKQLYAQYSALLNQKLDTLSLSKLTPVARELGIQNNPRTLENVKELAKVLGLDPHAEPALQEALSTASHTTS